MKLTGVTDSVISKSDVQSGVSSGVVPSMKPTDPAAVSSGSVKPVVHSGIPSGDVNGPSGCFNSFDSGFVSNQYKATIGADFFTKDGDSEGLAVEELESTPETPPPHHLETETAKALARERKEQKDLIKPCKAMNFSNTRFQG